MSRILLKKSGYHLERDINGNYVWVPNGKVGAEASGTKRTIPEQGTIKRNTPTKSQIINLKKHGDDKRRQDKIILLRKRSKAGDLKAAAELGSMLGQGEVTQREDPISDETVLASERAKYYFDPIKGISLRWNASWNNDTNPVKAVIDSPILYASPLTAAPVSAYHLTSDDGVKKTYNLAKQGEYGQAALSGLGDVLDASMFLHLPKGLNGLARNMNGELRAVNTPAVEFNPNNQLSSYGTNSFILKGSPFWNSLENITNPLGFKIVKDVTKNNPFRLSNYKFLGDNRFTIDMRNYPYSTLSERRTGNYPLTFGERRKWITDVKDDIKKGINFVKEEAETNPNITGLSSKEEAERARNLYNLVKNDDLPLELWDKAFNELNDLFLNSKFRQNFYKLLGANDTAHFGTRLAINKYGAGREYYPNLKKYEAFASLEDNGTYYPFRTDKGTLSVNPSLKDTGNRIETGGHEFEHNILKMFETPLVVYLPMHPNEYGRYTNYDLNLDLFNSAEDIISNADTYGKWEGSLAEMDSELKGWRALYNYPKYNSMTPLLKQHIIDLSNKRFGLHSDYSLDEAIRNSKAQSFDLDDYIKSTLLHLKFHKLYTNLESSGYKQGGKLIPRDKK